MDIIISQGVEGPSIYLNRYRIAGPKPWGGSTACRTLKITARDIREALRGTEVDYAALERELAELREQRDGLETRCKRMSIAHAELEANCAALVEAVRWERECEDAAMYVQRVKYKRRGVGANALCSARIYWDDAIAAVDALVAE